MCQKILSKDTLNYYKYERKEKEIFSYQRL